VDHEDAVPLALEIDPYQSGLLRVVLGDQDPRVHDLRFCPLDGGPPVKNL
jgi:hypothetical protein